MFGCTHRLAIAIIFIVMLGSSPAAAQLCEILRTVEGNQRILALAVSNANRATTGPAVQNHLTRTINSAKVLTQLHIPDQPLRNAVTSFAAQMSAVSSIRSQLGPTAAITMMKTASYRRAENVLIVRSQSYCDRDTGAQVFNTAGQSIMWQVSGLPWKTGVPVALVLVMLMGALGYAFHRILVRRDARRARYTCNVPVTVIFDTCRFNTRMIDISAIGAKIAIPEAETTCEYGTLIVDEKRFKFKRAWNNLHYAGLTFNPPLRLRTVKRWASSRQNRRKIKAGSGAPAAS